MALFGKKSEGGVLDVIRCDKEDYLVWKWRPSDEPANSTKKENSIRWGSSLRVKDGEVAVFVYKQGEGSTQEFIEGPFDETIKTANFPIISNIIGLAFAGQSPFQAEVYFINLAGIQKLPFGVPGGVPISDPRFPELDVKTRTSGAIIFKLTDYRGFIKKHRLIDFELKKFNDLIRSAIVRNVTGVLANIPVDMGIPLLTIPRKINEINEFLFPKVAKILEDFGVNLVRFDLDNLELDKEDPHYKALQEVTSGIQTDLLKTQAEVNKQNLWDTQSINKDNMSETMRIQREQAELFQTLQTQTQHLSAHQINQQAGVLTAAAENLGQMGQMGGGGLVGGSGSGSGMNPAGIMMAMGVGGAMGNQMANMANISGQGIQQQMMAPPPMPQIQYNVSVNGQSLGPFNMSQLQGMVAQGQLTSSTHVWKAGMANWEVASNVAELAPLFSAPPPPPQPPPPPNPS